ncbi:hypothetical protein Clacol_000733 [Clathrus columnatus]|uniref:Uncharacterized protein n=1 Tax=Clathrus columnatus TaxID=1419009 RepID=A0AAV4ZX13_9AGAM|nr:hypothetical protein Clacol_000733 [Clathrus columnatus]
MSSSAVHTAALAFAISSWIEGLTQLRTVLLTPGLRREDEEDYQDTAPLTSHATLKEKIMAWLNRNGRPDIEMDDLERTSLGAADIVTAFAVLQTLKQPILPFLLSPFFATLPIPRTSANPRSIKWTRLLFTTIFLSVFHEAERVTVSLAVEMFKKHREAKNRALLGDVYVRGDPLRRRTTVNEEEEEDCLICAGVGADNPLSQSISSISSMATNSVAAQDTLGPLEAFCANAPQKHIAHRSCFLSWHAAYRQQRRHLPAEYIILQHPHPSEAVRKRAQTIVEAAGLPYLSRLIRFPHELPWIWPHPGGMTEPRRHFRPILTLTENSAGSSSLNNVSRCLATLHTMSPPCPGCRSSIFLQIYTRPGPRRFSKNSRTYKDLLNFYARIWYNHWCKLVAPKTILYRLASQWSFVMALLSMIRISGGPLRYTYS